MRQIRKVPTGPPPRVHSKLLNMRDFRALSGFPLAAKTRYNSMVANRLEHCLGLFPPAWPFMPKRAIGQAKFRAYICCIPIHEVISAVPKGKFYRLPYCRRRPESECDVDIYTIIFLALAVFIFLRLRNVLGQRTGNERPPYDRTARNLAQGAQDNNVVPMPGAVIDQAPLAPTADVAPPTDRWKGIAESGTPLAHGLDAIADQDSSFDARHFLSGARSAYEMIVLAFANGDRRALKDLLSSEVYESFDTVIKDREKHEQKTETRFVSIDKVELMNAEARDRSAQLTVRFVSQMISVTRDKTGTIVDGNPDKVTDITDVWTFARDITSRDPNWKLVGTGSAH
jgi:predicted lipid-binding transport protein (Tim44 family)